MSTPVDLVGKLYKPGQSGFGREPRHDDPGLYAVRFFREDKPGSKPLLVDLSGGNQQADQFVSSMVESMPVRVAIHGKILDDGRLELEQVRPLPVTDTFIP